MIPPATPAVCEEPLATQVLAGRASVPISIRLIHELIRPIRATLTHRAVRWDGRADTGRLQPGVVGMGPVLGVGHHLLHLAVSDPDMFLDQTVQEILVGHLARSDLDRGDDARVAVLP
jgi:hypothetical protein